MRKSRGRLATSARCDANSTPQLEQPRGKGGIPLRMYCRYVVQDCKTRLWRWSERSHLISSTTPSASASASASIKHRNTRDAPCSQVHGPAQSTSYCAVLDFAPRSIHYPPSTSTRSSREREMDGWMAEKVERGRGT